MFTFTLFPWPYCVCNCGDVGLVLLFTRRVLFTQIGMECERKIGYHPTLSINRWRRWKEGVRRVNHYSNNNNNNNVKTFAERHTFSWALFHLARMELWFWYIDTTYYIFFTAYRMNANISSFLFFCFVLIMLRGVPRTMRFAYLYSIPKWTVYILSKTTEIYHISQPNTKMTPK